MGRSDRGARDRGVRRSRIDRGGQREGTEHTGWEAGGRDDQAVIVRVHGEWVDLIAGLVIAACGGRASTAEANVKEPSTPGGKPAAATIKLSSSAFTANGSI